MLCSDLLYSALLHSAPLRATLIYTSIPSSLPTHTHTLLFSPIYSTLLYSPLLYSTLPYSTLLSSTLRYLLYSTLIYSTLLYPTLLYPTLI